MGKRAVLVGCNYPGTDFELGGSINDVKIVKEMLIETYGFKEEHIKVLVDVKGVFKKSIFPTGKSIKKALKDLLRVSAKGDALVFHFSGHGGVIPSDDEGSGDGDNLQSFLLPMDYNILTSDDFKKILTKFPLSEGATFTIIADASQSDGLIEGHMEMVNLAQPPRTLLRRIREEAEEEVEDEAVTAKSTGEATAAKEGATVSSTDASSTPAPAADEPVDYKKDAAVKTKEAASTTVKEPAAAAKEAVPAVKDAAPAAAAAAKESSTAAAAVKKPAAPKEPAATASKKSPTAVAKSTGNASTKPAVSAKGAAAASAKAGAAANAKHAAAPTRPAPTAPTKAAAAAPAEAEAAAAVTTATKSLTVEVTEKPAPAAVSDPAANGSAEDSASGAEGNESAETEKEAGNEATGRGTAEAEVPKVVGPQARQIALDTFLEALAPKAKKKPAKGNIRRTLHDAFGDSSSRTVKNYVHKLRRQKSSPIHRRGLSALMEIFSCTGIAEANHGKGNQPAGKGPATGDSDESKTLEGGADEEIEHIQSCILLTAARRNQDVHDNGENGLFTDTLVKVVKKHKDDGSLESLSNFHLISCVAEIITNDMNIEQKPGLESSETHADHPFILGLRKEEEPKAVNGEAEDKKEEESAGEPQQESSADTTESAAAAKPTAAEPTEEEDESSKKPELSTTNVKENGVAKEPKEAPKEGKEAKPAADKAQKTEGAANK